MSKVPLSLLIISLTMQIASAQKQVVLRGIPLVRVVSSPENSNREVLTASQQNEFQLLITKKRGNETYIWETREGIDLMGFRLGSYHHFIAMGSGWIKVADIGNIRATGEQIADAGLLESMTKEQFIAAAFAEHYIPDFMQEYGYVYYEVTTQGMLTVTYWGVAQEFSP